MEDARYITQEMGTYGRTYKGAGNILALKPISYDRAVELLDEYMHREQRHNVTNLMRCMEDICQMKFATEEDAQDFAQMCTNFSIYVNNTATTSISTKEFEKWWDVQSGYGLEEPLEDVDTEGLSEVEKLRLAMEKMRDIMKGVGIKWD